MEVEGNDVVARDVSVPDANTEDTARGREPAPEGGRGQVRDDVTGEEIEGDGAGERQEPGGGGGGNGRPEELQAEPRED